MSWTQNGVSADEAVSSIESGMRVFVHGACATPTPLLEALCRRTDLRGVRVYHLHTSGPCPLAEPSVCERIRSISLFAGPALRQAIAEGRAEFIPVFLSDIGGLFHSRRIPLDAALLQLSEPDRRGHCTLGSSVDVAHAAAKSAPLVIAEINAQMPRTHGYTAVPMDRISAYTVTDRPLNEHAPSHIGPVEDRIGELIAELVEDGDTLQMGIGAIPDAALRRMFDKRDLGVHTEMFSDNLVDLVEAGVITGARKHVHRGRIVTSFVAGTRKVLDFIDDNLMCELHPAERTNDTRLISKNPGVVAINSALEVDLTGQVCADSLGHRIYSGIGGQMDFIRGAAVSENGKPIIALPSTAAGGTVSRISVNLKTGAGVVTTRGHVHWVVTEFGAVNLHGMTLSERADALISIAHPDFRAELRNDVKALRHFSF